MRQEKKISSAELQNPEKQIDNLADLTVIDKVLAANNLELTSQRQQLSSGFNGPIFLLQAKNTVSGQDVNVVEKTFIYGGDVQKKGQFGKRYWLLDKASAGAADETRARLGIVDQESGEVKKVVIDWLYNEEQALKNLQDVPGIPKIYGSAYDKLKGSILEEYIDGFDLFSLVDEAQSTAEINQIFDKIIATYTQAAAKGYLYNRPIGSTIMIAKQTKQPYLIDWYSHSTGDINKEGSVKNKFETGLNEIENLRQTFLKEFESK